MCVDLDIAGFERKRDICRGTVTATEPEIHREADGVVRAGAVDVKVGNHLCAPEFKALDGTAFFPSTRRFAGDDGTVTAKFGVG